MVPLQFSCRWCKLIGSFGHCPWYGDIGFLVFCFKTSSLPQPQKTQPKKKKSKQKQKFKNKTKKEEMGRGGVQGVDIFCSHPQSWNDACTFTFLGSL